MGEGHRGLPDQPAQPELLAQRAPAQLVQPELLAPQAPLEMLGQRERPDPLDLQALQVPQVPQVLQGAATAQYRTRAAV